nr:alpha/beta hydrolase [Hymenobacter arizonensis]
MPRSPNTTRKSTACGSITRRPAAARKSCCSCTGSRSSGTRTGRSSKNSTKAANTPSWRPICGATTCPPNPPTCQAKVVVKDLRQLAEHLGRWQFTLVAHDWGGGIAWWFAIVHPEYLTNLVILNASHPAIFQRELAHNPQQQAASAYMDRLVNPQAEQALAADKYQVLADVVFGPGRLAIPYTDAEQHPYRTAWAQPGALTGALNYYRAFHSLGYGLPTTTYQVKAPTLVIWGEQDPYVLPSNLTGLEQYVPELTIQRIANGTHWVLHEQPARVNKYIHDFIR